MDPADNIFTFPKDSVEQNFEDSKDAVAHLIELYQTAADFLCAKFVSVLETGDSSTRYRAYYPEVRITTKSYASVDSRLSFGHISSPGTFATTITRPALFQYYLEQQLSLLMDLQIKLLNIFLIKYISQ